MKIATMATGGIGGFLAVRLTQAGHQVATIARGAHLEAIATRGLTLSAPGGTETIQPWKATDTPSDVGIVDAIIFGVKGDALETAARACAPMVGEQTVVVPFLNGVEAADRLADVLPQHSVADGMAQVSTTIAAPGVIEQTGLFARFFFAERDNRPSDRIGALRVAMGEAGVEAPVPKDISVEVWTKFVLFTAMSGVTAAARCSVADIRTIPELGALYRAVLEETAAIGRASGVALPADVAAKLWERLDSFPPAMRASTAIDLEQGRPLEIDWISGAAARLAAKAGVASPINSTLYSVLLPFKNGR